MALLSLSRNRRARWSLSHAGLDELDRCERRGDWVGAKLSAYIYIIP